jgi:6-phosphogluconolactonase
MTVTVRADEEAVATFAAERLTALVEAAIAARGSAMVCLTGGQTPRRLYEQLADEHGPWRTRITWPCVHLCWGDERHVPPDHPDSNFGMADRALLGRVPVAGQHVHRIRAELADAAAAARDYDVTLVDAFAAAGRADSTFDVMLLGLGEDAHIASIFPGSPLLHSYVGRGVTPRQAGRAHPTAQAPWGSRREGPPYERDPAGRVAAVWAPHLDAWRITLTPRAILDARAILMIVAGAAKAGAVHAALDLPLNAAAWPAQLLREADDRVEWIMDAAAAARRPVAPRA